jgi:uncharacterized membrane protein required for colicin V production
MAIDALIIVLLVLFTIHGYARGFLNGLTSLVTPLLGIGLALRYCDGPALLIDRLFHNYHASAVAAFMLILVLFWLSLVGARFLLRKLIDWSSMLELDQFIGGLLGFAKGFATVWLFLALCLTLYPPAVHLLDRSTASVRILSVAEGLGAKPVELAQGETDWHTHTGNLGRHFDRLQLFESEQDAGDGR